MDDNFPSDTTQVDAAAKLAAVARELEQAAANAPTPAERLTLMRQWRKVQDAHYALLRPEAVNTQSIPIQTPAAASAPVAAVPLPSSAAAPALQKAPSVAAPSSLTATRVLILGLVAPLWLLGCFGVNALDSQNLISPDAAIVWYQLGTVALLCAILAVVFGHQWLSQLRRAASDAAQPQVARSSARAQVIVGLVAGYVGLAAAALATLLLIGFLLSPSPFQW